MYKTTFWGRACSSQIISNVVVFVVVVFARLLRV